MRMWKRFGTAHTVAKKELELSNKTSIVKGATICDAYCMLVVTLVFIYTT